MRVSNEGLDKIKGYEAFREFAYPDPASALFKAFPSKEWGFKPASEISVPPQFAELSAKPWTVGYGFIKGVTPNSRMSRAQADARLRIEIQEYEDAVSRACVVKPTRSQFDAMVSLTWNIGIAAFLRSSVLKAHNRKDFLSASRAFGLFNRAGGKENKGLTRRRAAEAAYYLVDHYNDDETVVEELPDLSADTGNQDVKAPEMPQAVDPERTMTQSPINRAGIIAASTTTVAAVSESVSTIASVKSGVESLGQWLLPVLLIAVAALCCYIIWNRYQQRKRGWV